jgi:hypothetical protein
MAPVFLSIANVLVAEMANQTQYSSTLIEVVKILGISSVWIGGLLLWIKSNHNHKMQIQQLGTNAK